ncbi:helix-turn-helix domain-containing protein [Nocardia brasiliensis]|nr:helix-turn-helix domain-containing protein [Nocardia brasiliensis]
MATVLDTSTAAPEDRGELVADAIQSMTAPSHIALAAPGITPSARIDAWQLGVAELGSIRTGGYSVVRSQRQVRTAPAPNLMLFLSPASRIRWSQNDARSELAPGLVCVANLNRPLVADWRGGAVSTLQVPLDALGITANAIERATDRLTVGPLQSLVAWQINLAIGTADALANDPGAGCLGDAFVDLVHALITSEAARNGDGTVVPADLLIAQIRAYIDRHLTDPELGPHRIATAHHISVRYLYKLCARTGFSLEQLIIAQRLSRVHRALADARNHHLPIATIAQQHGFRDSAHFHRRFRAAFGMTPHEWRRTAEASGSLGGEPEVATNVFGPAVS